MKLVSAGAARTVTGSCHWIETSGRRIVVDCGFFQGPPELEALNHEAFPFHPSEIDALLLTHGHLDHVGRLPLLVRNGYAGPIHTIGTTRRISEIILLDSAKIQREDHERAARADDGKAPPPLYTEEHVEATMALFREVSYDAPVDLGGGVRATFRPAGHILGSAWVEIEGSEGRLVASGDLGNRESGLQGDPVPPPACDAVLVETTYADRTHRSLEKTVAEFRDVLKASLEGGGNVMIPSFALERTQGVLYHLKNLIDSGAVPRAPIYLDSPMASRMTELYETAPNEFLPEIGRAIERGENPFGPDTLRTVATVQESKAINQVEGGAIIIAGSGMMTGGRIVHHLKHNLWREEASLVVVGYQAEGTLGRRIVDGAQRVRILGDEIPVRATVSTINGFSAHADRDDLLAWLESTGKARICLVHGEEPVMEGFSRTLAAKGRDAVAVERNRPYDLTGL